MQCTGRVDFQKSFWASLKHLLLSLLEDHWCLCQTLKCTRTFSTNFHNVWNPVTSMHKLYWIFFSCLEGLQIYSFFIVCKLIFAPLNFFSLLEICAPTHISHDICEKWKFSWFYREIVNFFLFYVDLKILLLC